MSDELARQRMMLGAFEEALEEEGFAPEGYEVSSELARGGMAVVYLAKQLQPEREVALKMVLPKFADDAEIRERFQREGKAMAALDHPGVLPVYQVGEWEGMAFLVMKLARGGSLQERLGKGVPDVREAVGWLIDAGEAVHFAHQRGVLHRDLKPGNFLFDDSGTIYVSDFGVAKMEFASDGGLTRTEALVGTPNYLAPEVAAGTASGGSVAADLYGLGAVLYECLAGRRPHEGAENLAAQLRAVVDEEVEPVRKIRPEVARDLEVICAKALAKDPADRYGSVANFVEDLRRWQKGRVILAKPASFLEKTARWAKRHPLSAGLMVALVALAAIGSVVLFENYERRGELLHDSLIERARAERLVREPGFRGRALTLLQKADEIRETERIREEAVAVLALWDAGSQAASWGAAAEERPVIWSEGEGGLRISENGEEWFLPGGVLRCEPARSPDGRFLALVRGERMEVLVYDVVRRIPFARVPAKDWPERLVFGESGEFLKVEFSDGSACLASVQGEVLLEGVGSEKGLLAPVGFRFWQGQYTSPLEVNSYGGQLSEDEQLLATTSATGVQLWDVEAGRTVDFYEVENQRIDAPTDVWWLGPRRLMVQVPGALEILTLDQKGLLSDVKELAREPGTKVKAIQGNGDWVVEVRNEEDEVFYELWPSGESEEGRELSLADLPKDAIAGPDSHKVRVKNWVLTPPNGREMQQVFRLRGNTRVIVITEDYRVCDWDLGVLERELEKLGL